MLTGMLACKCSGTYLKEKFRALPGWADEKLQGATSVQVQRWLKKILTAETLEGVLGKK
jgi:hypothetical protein